jgi:O-antigen ligase
MTKETIESKLSFHLFFLFIYSFFIFVLIIKFGIPAALSEVNSFPLNYAEWLIFSWPPILFTSIAAVLLLSTSIYSLIKSEKTGSYKFQIPGLWILFTISSLSGFTHASCFDIPYMQCFYFAGISALAASVYYLKKLYTPYLLKKYLLGAVFWASVLIVLYGLHQYLFGFNETRNYLLSSRVNLSTSNSFYTRLMQNYIFSTFSLTNTLGGFLVLVTPMSIWYAYTFTQTKLLKYIFSFIVFLFFFTALFLTGSRSAVLSIAISIFFISITSPLPIKTRISAIIIAVLSVITGILYLSIKGAALASLMVRLDYYTVALKLFFNNIFTGSGWGNFFYSFGFMKTFPSPEASHSPHNFILSVASQSGIISTILILIIALLPIIVLYKKLYKKESHLFKDIRIYLLIGIIALFLHMLFDTDFQIPAILLTVTIFSIIAVADESIKLNIKTTHNKILSIKNIVIFVVSYLLIITIFLVSIYIIPARYTLQKLYSACFPIPNSSSKVIDRQKQRSKIETLFKNTVPAQPYSPLPWAITGEYCLLNHNWTDAEFCFTNAVLRSPQRASYYYKLFICQAYQKKIREALKNLKKAKELFPMLYSSKYNNFIKQLKEAEYVQ